MTYMPYISPYEPTERDLKRIAEQRAKAEKAKSERKGVANGN